MYVCMYLYFAYLQLAILNYEAATIRPIGKKSKYIYIYIYTC